MNIDNLLEAMLYESTGSIISDETAIGEAYANPLQTDEILYAVAEWNVWQRLTAVREGFYDEAGETQEDCVRAEFERLKREYDFSFAPLC